MEITKEFLKKYDKPGPRYTSYPPATFFNDSFDDENLKECLIRSNNEKPQNISIYIHIPFCPQRCHFCGCNTMLMKDEEFINRYIKCIIKEINTYANLLDTGRQVTQIHWGGGTPNSISKELIGDVMRSIKSRFAIAENCEIAIECNPAYLDDVYIDFLIKSGFNRISLGIQDFNLKVLECVNRKPSRIPVNELIASIRKIGFKGVNLDLIYGLPMQTLDSFRDTIEKAINVSPDRLVTFSYAHVPWIMEKQKKLEAIGLPSPEEKLSMLVMSLKILTDNGYISIGMDHYAKPDDSLAIALKEKKLHRNFQGYCTRETTGQVYGFGTSSISQLWSAYSQNEKNVNRYIEKIEKQDFAVERGYLMTKKDQIIRAVINELMCNNYLDFAMIAGIFNLSVKEIKETVSFTSDSLGIFEEDGLVEVSNDTIRVSPEGRFVIRNIAMALDPALKSGDAQYSRTV